MRKSTNRVDPGYARRRKIVGVMGSGDQPFASLSQPVGKLIAELGHHLLTGGGGGVMAAVSESYAEVKGRKGSIIGIIRAHGVAHLGKNKKSRDYRPERPPNPWVEIPILTHLPDSGTDGTNDLSRNHINVLSSDVVVVLPGSAGTFSELQLALQYGWPAILYLGDETLDGRNAATIAAEESGLVSIAQNIEELRALITKILEADIG